MRLVTVSRKPCRGTTVTNAAARGCGALNVDGCRVGTTKNVPASPSRTRGNALSGSVDGSLRRETGQEDGHNPNVGRWPANMILCHAAADDTDAASVRRCQRGCPVRELDEQSGIRKTTWISPSHQNNRRGDFLGQVGHPGQQGYNDTGTASRFFKQVAR